MSRSRTAFCERIAAVRAAITQFNLNDLPPIPQNASHNNSARIIRNGLAVQCFNIFEDFIKARIGEVLSEISASGVPFRHLPEDLQSATTVEVIKAINYQIRFRDKADHIRFTQDFSEKIYSTKLPAIQLAEIAFFHSSPNISKENFRDTLAAFSIDKPWTQITTLCSRTGISGLPAENVFYSLAQRRHSAAHDANTTVTTSDLTQSFMDAIGLAFGFDVLITKATNLLTKIIKPVAPGHKLITNSLVFPLRFVKFSNGKFGEIKENARRFSRLSNDRQLIIRNALARTSKVDGALLVFDQTNYPEHWLL